MHKDYVNKNFGRASAWRRCVREMSTDGDGVANTHSNVFSIG